MPRYPSGLDFLTGDRSFLLIADNGVGMSYADLIKSLTIGSSRVYEDYELGHFGIGMKDSTLSQTYEVTLFSKTSKSSPISILRLSSIWIQQKDDYQFLTESDFIEDFLWMKNTDSYKRGYEGA